MAGEYKAVKQTIGDRVCVIEDHAHSAAKVYPTLANGVTVTGGAGAWELGDYVEVVPANTITLPFDIHWMNIGNASAADTYELVLYAVTTEIGRCRFSRPAGSLTNSAQVFMTPIIAKNSQIQARVASAGGGGDTITFSIAYHIY